MAECLNLIMCIHSYRLAAQSLRAGRSGDRIPVGSRFSEPVQTGPGAHPTFYTKVTGSFPGVKRPGIGVDGVELYLHSSSGSSLPVLE